MDEYVPVFGERRSPSCVEDWLEINDFDSAPVPIDSPVKLKTPVNLSKNSLNIQTRFLQRENTFRSSGGSSSRTVKSLIESFSKSNQIHNESSKVNKSSVSQNYVPLHPQGRIQSSMNFFQNKPSKLSRSAFVTVPKKNVLNAETPTVISGKNFDVLAPRITSSIPKISLSVENIPVNTPSVLASLKPARRKKRPAPRAEDIYTNSKEKQQIIQAMSNLDIRTTDENYDVVIDSFSLEGEFV